MKAFVVCFVFLATFASVRTEEIENKFQPLQCNNGTLGPSDEQGGRIGSECVPKYGTAPGQENPDCLYFCQSEVLGLLNAEGLTSRVIYDKFVEFTFPENYRAKGLKWFGDCYEKYGQYVVKADQDPTCKIAGQFNTCTWSIKPELTC